jgi:hypothetical protein
MIEEVLKNSQTVITSDYVTVEKLNNEILIIYESLTPIRETSHTHKNKEFLDSLTAESLALIPDLQQFEDIVKETFEVYEINGSSTYICYPVIDETLFDEYEIDYQQREICDIVVRNWKEFNFVLRKDTFGKNPFTPENGLVESMKSEKPYTMSDAFLLENKISILRIQNYLSFKFPLVNKIATNLMREDVIKSDFVDSIKNQAVNKVVDMEKDVYFPVYKKKCRDEVSVGFYGAASFFHGI